MSNENPKEPTIDLKAVFHRHNPVTMIRHKQYRKLPQVGDVYAIDVDEHGWLLLRVVHENPSLTEGESSSDESAYIIYIYKGIHSQCPDSIDLPIAPVLLMPPLIVSRLLWMQGYCVFVGHGDLMPSEKLGQHCFWIDRTWLPEDLRGSQRFQDEYGEVFYNLQRPCGLRIMSFPQGVEEKLGTFLRDGFDQDNHPLC